VALAAQVTPPHQSLRLRLVIVVEYYFTIELSIVIPGRSVIYTYTREEILMVNDNVARMIKRKKQHPKHNETGGTQ
jgi:hypothetical protein